MITGLQHVGIYVEDIEQSIAFYERVLGFHLACRGSAMEGELPLTLIFMKHPSGIVIELLHCEGKNPKQSALATPNHICLRTDDAAKMYKELEKQGVAFECEPFTAPFGYDRPMAKEDMDIFRSPSPKGAKMQLFFLRGPSGERIEIMADNLGWETDN